MGRNMMLLEYKRAVLIIDMGLRFPEENMPGVDFIIPDVNYLRGKEKDILGVVISHGHYDHIGAIPYLIDKISSYGKNSSGKKRNFPPPIFASPLTRGVILRRMEDFPHLPKINITAVKDGSRIKLGPFQVEFFRQNHKKKKKDVCQNGATFFSEYVNMVRPVQIKGFKI